MLSAEKKLIISSFIGSFLGGFFYQYNILNFSVIILMMMCSFVSGLYLQKNKNFIEKYSNQLELVYKPYKNKLEIFINKINSLFDKKRKGDHKIYTDKTETVITEGKGEGKDGGNLNKKED